MAGAGGGRATEEIRAAALIPAYQAGETIGVVVRGVRALMPQVLVVDDGSTDATAAAAREAGAEMVRHVVNRGKGAALVTGLAALAAAGATHALTLDADGQHLPGEIPKLLAASARQPRALVIGERLKEGHAIRGINLLGNWVADRLMTAIAGTTLPDTQSGFRVYPIAATLALGARGSRFDFETEILLRAARAGMPLTGVPVVVHYPPVAERVSHYRPWVDTVRIVRTVARIVFGDG